MAEKLSSTTLVIFGVTGDLSRRYLLPALSEICRSSDISASLKILGLSRSEISADEVLNKATGGLKNQLETFKMDYGQADEYDRLRQKLETNDSSQIIFYFAVPPQAVPAIVDHLGKAEMNSDKYRLLMEKPFGQDLASAKELIKRTSRNFSEDQTYRIDHYLAKEVAQNIAVFLGSNAIFRHVWNHEFISYIEIVVAEKIGIEGRAGFYEQTGALRDIIQSHGLQLAALTLMEPCPNDFDFTELPARRYAALKKLKLAGNLNETAVRAQYDGYKSEVDNPSSTAETFAAIQLESADPRWKGVPIYMATGKNLDQRLTQIRISFKQDSNSEQNILVLRVQPREGIELDLWVKQPGYERRLQKKELSFSYEQDFDERLPNAYEQILVDAIRGSHSLFASSREVIESWRILEPLLSAWQAANSNPKTYKPGSSVEQILQNT